MDNGILAAGAQDIDFMIHGLFSYKIFGHEVWITTSHVCILIIMLILIAFSFIVKHKMKAATEVPGGFQNVVELMVENIPLFLWKLYSSAGGNDSQFPAILCVGKGKVW